MCRHYLHLGIRWSSAQFSEIWRNLYSLQHSMNFIPLTSMTQFHRTPPSCAELHWIPPISGCSVCVTLTQFNLIFFTIFSQVYDIFTKHSYILMTDYHRKKKLKKYLHCKYKPLVENKRQMSTQNNCRFLGNLWTYFFLRYFHNCAIYFHKT